MSLNLSFHFGLAFILAMMGVTGGVYKGYGQDNCLRYVNPFIGTARSDVPTKWGSYGGTYPGAVAPSGAIQLTPETRISKGGGYDYADSAIYYFSCFRHSSGFPGGSSGRFFVMPVATMDRFEAREYCRGFLHSNEVAHPGYYKVVFDDNHTVVEATTTARTGMFRFTFPPHVIPRIFIGDAGNIVMQSEKSLLGSNDNTVINFSDRYIDRKRVKGGWIFTFPSLMSHKKVIVFKLSKSSVSFKSAQKNIDEEIGKLDFDQIYARTRKEWSRKLAVVDIIDPDEDNKTIFYTALYHSLLIPWVIDDVDGRYRGADGMVYQKSGNDQLGKFSPWDTFRSLNPLLTLLYPDKAEDVLLSMLDIYKQRGGLPSGSMTGNHAVPIIVDSYLKGITGFDTALAYNAMKKSIVDSPYTQSDMEIYRRTGYIPDVYPESVTRTVEYAYDDWALSQFSRVVNDHYGYKMLTKEGGNYRNLFNAQELLLLPRNDHVYKLHPGNAGYKEGDKWIYSFFVPQNARDLINLMGGDGQFSLRLDSAFSSNLILFDNEAVFGIPYLFNQAGRPSLTQKWCRRIMCERYHNTPGGIPGNDDLGAMSSWYVFAALGVYPVCPGRPLYAVNAPLFERVTLHLPNGKTFVIQRKNATAGNIFIQSLLVNGRSLQRLTIPHSLLLKGGEMTFDMGRYPDEWPVNKDQAMLSETKIHSNIKILDDSVRKRSVEPDEPFFVYFSLTNKGSLGTRQVRLLVNGRLYAYKNCLVAPGRLMKDSIKCRLYPVGKSTLKLAGLRSFGMEVKRPQVVKRHPFKITGLTAKPMVKQSEMQNITYGVQNITGYQHTFYIPLMINDSLISIDTVVLSAGAKRHITHVNRVFYAGSYMIDVGGFKERYKVYGDDPGTLLLDLSSINHPSDNVVKDRSGFQNDGYINESEPGNPRRNTDRLLFGKDCFVEVKKAESLDVMGQTITMMAWVYPTERTRGLAGILTKGDNDVLQVSDGKTISFFAGGWGRGNCTVELPPDWIRHWHHVAGVCTGKRLFLYIDGLLKGTTDLDSAVNLSNVSSWYLGRNEEFPSARIFEGYIDKVKVFGAALKQNEVDAIMQREIKHIGKKVEDPVSPANEAL